MYKLEYRFFLLHKIYLLLFHLDDITQQQKVQLKKNLVINIFCLSFLGDQNPRPLITSTSSEIFLLFLFLTFLQHSSKPLFCWCQHFVDVGVLLTLAFYWRFNVFVDVGILLTLAFYWRFNVFVDVGIYWRFNVFVDVGILLTLAFCWRWHYSLLTTGEMNGIREKESRCNDLFDDQKDERYNGEGKSLAFIV